MDLQQDTQRDDIKKRWELFIKHQWLSPKIEQSLISQSWLRCIRQCNPYVWNPPCRATGYTFKSILERAFEFNIIASRVTEDCYQSLINKDSALFVVDNDGCTLSIIGTEQIKHSLSVLGFEEGCFWNEGFIGTNAFNLSMITNNFEVVSGAEHFYKELHLYTMSSSPIIDLGGKKYGAIIFVTSSGNSCSELIASKYCANEISQLIYIESELLTSNKMLCQHNAVIECMDDGFICWDKDMNLTMVNDQVEKILNLSKGNILGKKINDVFILPTIVSLAIQNKTKISHKQIVLECLGVLIEIMITLRPLSDGSYLLFIHPLEKIFALAQQQISNNSNFTFDSIYAKSKRMQYSITLAKRAMKSKSPILLSGEEGVGKFSMAMAIHNESDFHDGPFMSVNFRMLSPENMTFELLGSDENPSPSKFELAHGGTLYLENVEYLPSELQSTLLKLMKTGLVMRSDSARKIPVRFQLITSVTTSLNECVSYGSFSRQLYYEISANEIEIPPLRNRRDDLIYIIKDIFLKHEKRYNISVSIDDDAFNTLIDYSWPGNYAELKNVIGKILLHSNNNCHVTMQELPMEIKLKKEYLYDNMMTIIPLHELEKIAIENACKMHEWNFGQIANSLGISRTTLWRKLKTYNIHE